MIRVAPGETQFTRELGLLLQHVRQTSGLSQAALAEDLGIDQTTVSKVEGGHRRLTIAELFSWAEALGHSPEELSMDVATLWRNVAARPGTLWKASDD